MRNSGVVTGLDEGESVLAEAEARRYESLSREVRDSIWNEEADSIEAEAESREIDLPTS